MRHVEPVLLGKQDDPPVAEVATQLFASMHSIARETRFQIEHGVQHVLGAGELHGRRHGALKLTKRPLLRRCLRLEELEALGDGWRLTSIRDEVDELLHLRFDALQLLSGFHPRSSPLTLDVAELFGEASTCFAQTSR